MYFLYALDNTDRISEQKLRDLGLLDRLPLHNTLLTRGSLNGPANKGCLLIADSRCKPKDLRYDPATQTWTRSINDAFWIGYYTDQPPSAADLVRPSIIEGHTVTLADGSQWQVPCARVFPSGTNLPQILARTADGLEARPHPKYVQFSCDAEDLWNHYMTVVKKDPDGQTMKMAKFWDLCLQALSINYFISTDECNILGLLTTNNLDEIGAAVVDLPGVENLMSKKKQSASVT